jgi:hypothetical protein
MKSLDALKMCLNPKVIGALAIVGGLIFVFAPSLLVAALPLLLLAACPLSMLVMGLMMRGHDEHQDHGVVPEHRSADDELSALRAEVSSLRDGLDGDRRSGSAQQDEAMHR